MWRLRSRTRKESPLTSNIWSLLESSWRTAEPLWTTTYKRNPSYILSSVREVACRYSSKRACMRQLQAPESRGLNSWSSSTRSRRSWKVRRNIRLQVAWDEPQVSVRGLLVPRSAASEKLPDFEENSMEFEELRPPSESQRVQRPSQTLRSADHGVPRTPPTILLL